MRALAVALPALLLASALPGYSQTGAASHYLKIDVKEGSDKAASHQGPGDVHIRIPLKLAKSFLESLGEQEFQIQRGCATKNTDAKAKPQKIKVDQLVKLLEDLHSGDLILEVQTEHGGQVKITAE